MSGQVTKEGMLCPVCGVVLVMTERQGVEIDYCPKCRGVWLDRGELDKIIEHASTDARTAPAAPFPAGAVAAPSSAPSPWLAPGQVGYADAYRHQGDHDDHHHRDEGHGKYGNRRRSWLGELFD
jgi:uncharacterized protein